MGLARSGAGAANLLHSLGAAVTVTDSKTEESLKAYSEILTDGVRKVLGSHPDELFTKADLVIVSPGVPLTVPPLAKSKGRTPPDHDIGAIQQMIDHLRCSTFFEECGNLKPGIIGHLRVRRRAEFADQSNNTRTGQQWRRDV